jgi:hypothetical protein
MLHMLGRVVRLALLGCALLALVPAARAQSGKLVLAGSAWRPDAGLLRALRPPATPEPLLVVLHLDEDPRLAWEGWRVSTRALAAKVEPDGAMLFDEAAERVLAAQALAADAIVLHGGAWIDWWRRLFHGKKPGRVLTALREAHLRGVALVAFDDAATFLVGGLVPPEEVGRAPRSTSAAGRAWIVEGSLGAGSLVLECEGRAGRGPSRVFDAISRELRLAGSLETRRAWVLARDGALVLDPGRRRLAPLERPLLRLGFERARKSATKSLDEVECAAFPTRPDPEAWWRDDAHLAWIALDESSARDSLAVVATTGALAMHAAPCAFDLEAIHAALEVGVAADAGDATGDLRLLPSRRDESGARRAWARWTRREER